MEHPHPADGADGPDEAPDGPWREPARGGHPDARLAAQPGADLLQAILDGSTPAPPLSRLTGMRLAGFAPGTATFTLPRSPWLADATGTIPLGPLTIPADAAMACAIMTGLPAGTGLTTSELGLRQVRPVPAGDAGSLVTARGRVLDPGPPVALAEVTVTDACGRLIAHGSSLCLTLPALAAPDRPGGGDAPGDEPPGGPDPWQRPLPDGDAPPLGRLTGLHPVAAARGEAAFVLPATRWLCAPPPGRVQGGAVATLADAAVTATIRTTETGAGGRVQFHPVELKLNFLRPLLSDGRPARADGHLIHGGRRTAVAGAEVLDADGRVIAVATGSAVLGETL